MHHSEDVRQVLRQFPIAVGAIQAVDSDGFSGARLWRVTDGGRQYCLRCWPQETGLARVKSINSVLVRADLPFIPRPIVANSLESTVTCAGYVWTLQPWMPGQAVTTLPPPRKLLHNAMQALALFHRTTAVLEFADGAAGQKGSPHGLQSRAELTTAYLQSKLNLLKTAQIPSSLADLHARRERLLVLFLEVAPTVLKHSSAALGWKVPLQPCIRDIHAGHVLFTGDQVTGLIDFDAMRLDSVATDLARLLGNYYGDHLELWGSGLAAYDQIRPLSKDERDLVVHYDRFAVLLTGLQWLDWMLLEGKQFELVRVLPRIDATLARLEHLRDNLRIGGGRLIY